MAPMAVPTAAQSSNVNRSRGRAWPSRWTAIITVVSPVGPGLRGVSGVDSAWVCCPTACAVAVWPGRETSPGANATTRSISKPSHQARARLPVSAPLSHGESDAYALPWCQWRIRRTTCLRHLESRSDRCLWPRRLRWPARSRVRRPTPRFGRTAEASAANI